MIEIVKLHSKEVLVKLDKEKFELLIRLLERGVNEGERKLENYSSLKSDEFNGFVSRLKDQIEFGKSFISSTTSNKPDNLSNKVKNNVQKAK